MPDAGAGKWLRPTRRSRLGAARFSDDLDAGPDAAWAVEAYQEKQFEPGLSRAGPAKRIDALKREIDLANSF
jgi:hypothetical protein